MSRLSAERVKQELEKTMEQVRRPSRALGLWKSSGVLGTLIPDLATISDTTIRALDCVPMAGTANKSFRLLVRLTLPFIELGEERARAALSALRFSKAEMRRIADLARAWAVPGAEIREALAADVPVADVRVRRWVAAIGRLDIGPFMRVVNAMEQASRGKYAKSARLRSIYRQMLRVALRDPIAIADLAIDGDDLRIAGIPGGPWVGKILEALLDTVLGDPASNNRDWLLQEARRLYARIVGSEGP
jgi:tRNA nucleotidyltransferase/poly(A) polymerase